MKNRTKQFFSLSGKDILPPLFFIAPGRLFYFNLLLGVWKNEIER